MQQITHFGYWIKTNKTHFGYWNYIKLSAGQSVATPKLEGLNPGGGGLKSSPTERLSIDPVLNVISWTAHGRGPQWVWLKPTSNLKACSLMSNRGRSQQF